MRAVQRSPRLRPSTLLALALAWPALLPLPAQAQPAAVASPVVDGVEVNADAGLHPGSTLDFTVRGTPRAQARVQLVGSGIAVPLRETAPGRYSGRYTISRSDRIDVAQPIQAVLRANGRMVISNFDFPGSFQALRGGMPPVARGAAPRIDTFGADPVASLQPGAELRFVIDGTPGATASVNLPGIAESLPLQEGRPGHYVGRYTLRVDDRLQSGPVVATLRRGDAVSVAQLATPLVGALATSTLGAAPTTVAPVVVAPPAPLSLQVLSPAAGTTVESSQIVVRGRATPFATVHAQVHAIAPTRPGRAAVALPVTEQSVQADANGDFSFGLGAQAVPPGARLDVQLEASQGDQSTPVQRLELFQRQG